jgi:hypothetical protein
MAGAFFRSGKHQSTNRGSEDGGAAIRARAHRAGGSYGVGASASAYILHDAAI